MKKITLEEAYRRATKGPLRVSDVFGMGATIANADDTKPVCYCDCVDNPNKINAALLAHAFNIVPELVGALKELIGRVEMLDASHRKTQPWSTSLNNILAERKARRALDKASTVEIPE